MDFNIDKIKFDLNDILIMPDAISKINSRKQVNPYYNHLNLICQNYLPIIAAPMDTVIDKNNIDIFIKNKIPVCIPRGCNIDISKLMTTMPIFKSYSLDEFTTLYIRNKITIDHKYILIDMANGHMSKLLEIVKLAKDMYGNSIMLMVGNIANPETYRILSEAGADYIRCGIGSGGACTTSSNVSIGYPMGSLIKECYDISCTLSSPAKIVADGGMKNFSDIIKVICLGADYVMVGSIFNKSIESCGDTLLFKKIKIDKFPDIKHFLFKNKIPLYKKYRGMSTKEVQQSWGKLKLTTSEGIVKYNKVEYTVEGWTNNFVDYLKSAMSYCNAKTLKDFVGKAKYNLISYQYFNRFNK